MKNEKLLHKLYSKSKNISFSDLVLCAELYGFELDGISGSHHIFKHKDVNEVLNLQNVKGKAKPYQIKQFLKLIEVYNLKFQDE